jgi:hypothetical protein
VFWFWAVAIHLSPLTWLMVFGFLLLGVLGGVARNHYIGTCIALKKRLTFWQWITKRHT